MFEYNTNYIHQNIEYGTNYKDIINIYELGRNYNILDELFYDLFSLKSYFLVHSSTDHKQTVIY